MPKTTAQLIARALGNLGKTEPGQDPEAEDVQRVTNLVDPLLAQLSASGVLVVPDANQIDDHIFLPLAMLLANAAAPEFHIPPSMEAEAKAERDIRRATSSMTFSQPMEAEYF